jgi:hypothetical protein
MKKETYKDYVYFKMPIKRFNELFEKAKEKGRNKVFISFNELLMWKELYEMDMETKQHSAKEAHKRKKAKVDLKILNFLEQCFTSLFKNSECKDLTPYKLSKLLKIHYKTAKRFWNDYNLNYWIKEFEKRKEEAIKEFKYQVLSESLVYGR